ncbi:MAG: hypothetical protein WEB89_02265 [Balneolales bacterium]
MNKMFTKITISALLLIFCLSWVQEAKAQEGELGVGAAIGDYTGFSYKYWFASDYAVNGVVTGALRDGQSQLYVHWDLLVHRFDLIEVEEGSIPLYYGFGFFAEINQNLNNDAGFRIPIGIEYLMEDQKLGVFIEAAPTVQITNRESVSFQGGIGFRYYL